MDLLKLLGFSTLETVEETAEATPGPTLQLPIPGQRDVLSLSQDTEFFSRLDILESHHQKRGELYDRVAEALDDDDIAEALVEALSDTDDGH